MNERFEAFSTGPALIAIGLMALASLAATVGTHPLAMALVVAIGLTMVLITLDTGSHSMAMFTGLFLAIALGLAVDKFELDEPIAATIVGLLVIGFGDAIRLSFARRRAGVVEPAVVNGVLVGLLIVVIGSVATTATVVALTRTTSNVNWLLVPMALVLAVVGAVGLAIAVSRSPGQFDKRRWRPGERLLAPPREASDDPSFKSSVPPPPR